MPVNPLGMLSRHMKEKTREITDIVMMQRKNAEKRICEDAGHLNV